MDTKQKAKMASLGFRVSDVSEFLGLTEDERAIVEFRVALVKRILRRRRRLQLTQRKLALQMGSSQPRVAMMEAGHPSVSIELIVRGLFAVGGNLTDIASAAQEAKSIMARPTPRKSFVKVANS